MDDDEDDEEWEEGRGGSGVARLRRMSMRMRTAGEDRSLALVNSTLSFHFPSKRF